jgi:hypothetical protein
MKDPEVKVTLVNGGKVWLWVIKKCPSLVIRENFLAIAALIAQRKRDLRMNMF